MVSDGQETRPGDIDPGLTRRLHDLVREHPDFEVIH